MRLRENFRRVGQAYVEQLSQLRRVQSTLKLPPRRSSSRRTVPTHVTVTGNHRSLVTRTVSEQMPMVPGPKDPQ